MRSFIVFFLLFVMLVGLGTLLFMRDRPEHEMPAVVAVQESGGDSESSSEVTDGGTATSDATTKIMTNERRSTPDSGQSVGTKIGEKGGTKAQTEGDGGPTKAESPPEKLLDRPLRVIGLGWEVIAPGLVSNRGTTPGENNLYTKNGLVVHLSSSAKVVDVERALARGGSDEQGADVAIMPLPVFIAAHEQLRALSPRIFFVFGWSHGHEALLGFQDNILLKLPRSRDVQLVTEAQSPSHFFGLYILDLAGVSPDRVETVDRGDRLADSIALASLRQAARGQPAGAKTRRFIMTTADAPRLIPYVGVASEGFINTESDALRALCSHWLTGVEDLRQDVPAAARRIASIRGTPEALELLGLLGRVESSTLRENAEVSGLSGRSAITIDELFQTTWRIWRDADVVTSPMPEKIPMKTDVIAALVRQGSSMADGAAGTLGEREPVRRSPASGATAEPILVHRLEDRRMSDDDLVATIGLLARVFRPLALRVAIPGDSTARANSIVEATRSRFGVAESRLSATRRVKGRAAPLAIELLPQ